MKLYSLIVFALLASTTDALILNGQPKKDVITYGTRQSDVPERFTGPESDRLMWSVIVQYAQEKFVNGQPTGEFSLNKDRFKSISLEVVNTHHKNAKPSPDAWVDERLEKVWERADVLGNGRVAAERVPVMLREMLDNDPVLGFGL